MLGFSAMNKLMSCHERSAVLFRSDPQTANHTIFHLFLVDPISPKQTLGNCSVRLRIGRTRLVHSCHAPIHLYAPHALFLFQSHISNCPAPTLLKLIPSLFLICPLFRDPQTCRTSSRNPLPFQLICSSHRYPSFDIINLCS